MDTPEVAAPEQTATVDAPAADAVEQPGVAFNDFTGAERAEFLKSGKSPKREAKEPDGTTADSSTAPAEGEKAAETAATDVKAASEPAKPAKDTKAKKSDPAELRFDELLTDRKRERDRADRAERAYDELRKRLDALEAKKDGKTAESSPAADPSQPEWKKYRALPGAPKISDFEGPDALEDFVEAKALFIAKQIAKEQAESVYTERDKQSAEAFEAQREMDAVMHAAAERLHAEETADPTLKERINPGLRSLVPARLLPEGRAVGPHHYAKDWMVFESEKPGALHAFYSTPEGQQEWASMMRQSSKQIERTLIARELQLSQSSQVKADAEKPAPKTFTKTPPPPDKGGQKTAAVVDKADAAVKAGNFKDFMAAMNDAGR